MASRHAAGTAAGQITGELEAYLRSVNPWWEGRPGRLLPPYRRWAFGTLERKLDTAVAPIVVLRGARQVGKTTLQEQLIDCLLRERGIAPRRIFRIQFDEIPSLRGLSDPVLGLARWFESQVLGATLNEAAHAGQPAYVFFDEVQNVADWAAQLKALVDHHTVRVLVTGSSALRIGAASDSLAGRVTSLEIGTLLLREIAGLRLGGEIGTWLPDNGLSPLLDADCWRGLSAHAEQHRELRDQSFKAFSAAGGYPLVHAHPELPWPELADQLNETVIRRVIQHDLRLGERGRRRDPQLLEEVFRLACRYAGQTPGQGVLVAELQHVLQANLGWQRVRSYLQLLDGALLVKLVRPLELRLKRAKGYPKLCLADLGLRASWLEEVVPLDPAALAQAAHLGDLAGHLAESAVGSFLAGLPHLDLAHFPERATEPEVDFVLTIGERRIPLEVKYRRRIDPHRDTVGLRSFLERTHYNAPFGVLVTMLEGVTVPDPRIVPISLRSLLLMR
ncbi:MAG: ATP-binding protein [Armatimonadetes bacterium]|nr:ATP-binding protein [Armatimonadota bacterium]